jgi:hypothetical protein
VFGHRWCQHLQQCSKAGSLAGRKHTNYGWHTSTLHCMALAPNNDCRSNARMCYGTTVAPYRLSAATAVMASESDASLMQTVCTRTRTAKSPGSICPPIANCVHMQCCSSPALNRTTHCV